VENEKRGDQLQVLWEKSAPKLKLMLEKWGRILRAAVIKLNTRRLPFGGARKGRSANWEKGKGKKGTSELPPPTNSH